MPIGDAHPQLVDALREGVDGNALQLRHSPVAIEAVERQGGRRHDAPLRQQLQPSRRVRPRCPVGREEEREFAVVASTQRDANIGVQQQIADIERILRIALPGLHRLGAPHDDDAADPRVPGLRRRHGDRRDPGTAALGLRIEHHRLDAVDTGQQLRLPIEQDLAGLGGVEFAEAPGQQVLLARLVGRAPARVTHPYHHHGLGAVGALGLIDVVGQRIGLHTDDQRRQPRPRHFRKRQRPGSNREGVGQRCAVERGQGHALVAEDRHRTQGTHREVAAPREHARAGATHLDVDLAELPVELLVHRSVGEDVVEAHVLVDAGEGRLQVVGVTHEEPARVARQIAEARVRILPQHVLVALHHPQHRAADRQRPRLVLDDAVRAGGGHLATHLRDRALGTQTRGVDRVDRHVGAVGRVHHGPEGRDGPRRNRQPFGEEHDRLAAGNLLQAGHHRQQRVGGAEALSLALEIVEDLEHPALHPVLREFHLDAADGLRPRVGGRPPRGDHRAHQFRAEFEPPLLQFDDAAIAGLELRGAQSADLLQPFAHRRRIAAERLHEVDLQVDGEDRRLVLQLAAHRDASQGGTLRERAVVGGQAIEDQRHHAGGLGSGRGLGRRCTGRVEPHGAVALLRTDRDAGAAVGHRERPEGVLEPVLVDLEVVGRQVGQQRALAVADDDIHDDGRGRRLEAGGAGLTGRRRGVGIGTRLGPHRGRQERRGRRRKRPVDQAWGHHHASLPARVAGARPAPPRSRACRRATPACRARGCRP